MEQLNSDEKDALEKLSKQQFEQTGLEGRVVQSLLDKGLIQPSKKVINMQKVIVQIAAAIALLLLGYWAGNLSNPATEAPLAERGKYAIFLYENDDFQADDISRLVEEYGNWAQNLAESGHLIGAEKLNDLEDLWLGDEQVRNQTSRLSGYFVFYAQTMEEATQIAKTHPHTKYGGGIELRPIDLIE